MKKGHSNTEYTGYRLKNTQSTFINTYGFTVVRQCVVFIRVYEDLRIH